jgi:hypothetical protein
MKTPVPLGYFVEDFVVFIFHIAHLTFGSKFLFLSSLFYHSVSIYNMQRLVNDELDRIWKDELVA